MIIVLGAVSVAMLLVLSVWDVPTAPFLAVGSVVAVAVGFGAQNFVKDMIAGMTILAEGQFGLDDVVEIADVTGRVESVRLRTTVLRDEFGHVHHVPNGLIGVASNFTHDFGRIVVKLPVALDADVEAVSVIVEEEIRSLYEDPEWSRAFLAEPVLNGVDDITSDAIVLRMEFEVRTDYRFTAKREFLGRLTRRLDAEGLRIPGRRLDITIRPDGDPLR